MMYKFNEKVSVKALADLRESVGWNRMEKEYKNPLMTSYYHIAVYENDKLIGYIDSVSNGVSDAYIQDLMVCPDYQGKGIGTDLMDKMIEYLKKKNSDTKIIVITANDDFDIVRSMYNLKVDDYLLKPVKKCILTDTIRNRT